MSASTTLRAVLFDALGTLVELEPPWLHLGPQLGMPPEDPALISAFRAEMAYYREHHDEGRDPASLDALRRSCAEVLSRELGREVDAGTMMRAIRLRAFGDAFEALDELRGRGLLTGCVSNWDFSLAGTLDRLGFGDRLDAVVSSAVIGARKPRPEPFEHALAELGCAPAQALHVGDTPAEDVAGAWAAGIRALHLDREGGGDIAFLAQIPQHLGR